MVIKFRNLDQCERLRQFFRLQKIKVVVWALGVLTYRFEVEGLNHRDTQLFLGWLVENKLLDKSSLH